MSNVAAASVWDGSTASSFAGGTGAREQPYLISNGAQLAYMRAVINASAEDSRPYEYYQLTSDLHLGSIPWIPIGVNFERDGFHFDGKGHVIEGLEVRGSQTMDQYMGLFGYLNYGSFIRDLHIVNGNVIGRQFVGGLAGALKGKMSQCSYSGKVSGNNHVGGLAGTLDGYMYDCFNEGTVSGQTDVGGLVGKLSQGCIHAGRNCGEISGVEMVGGIVGYDLSAKNIPSLILDINDGDIKGKSHVGGIAGAAGEVWFSANRAKIQGDRLTGGICGAAESINYCYNIGTVDGKTLCIGGIAGECKEINESINTAGINGNAVLPDYVISGCYGSVSDEKKEQSHLQLKLEQNKNTIQRMRKKWRSQAGQIVEGTVNEAIISFCGVSKQINNIV